VGAVLATPCPQFPSSLPLCWGRLSWAGLGYVVPARVERTRGSQNLRCLHCMCLPCMCRLGFPLVAAKYPD
jgi:hypothetical protein